MKRAFGVRCGLLAVAVVLAACGGSGDSPTRTDGPVRGGPSLTDGGGDVGGGGGDAPVVLNDGGTDTGPGDAVNLDLDPEAPTMLDCTGKADGAGCGDGMICVMNACASSRCGDGYKDTATGEECEDGNEADGDGCAKCRFECHEDKDCDDGSVCNGAETCDKTMAAAGKQLCKAGTMAANGTACMTEGAAGSCNAGNCMKAGCGNGTVDTGEECDDMNADDADGCTRACKFTCKANADCSDGNMCTGSETCNTATHRCQPGTAVTCASMGSCQAAGTCMPMTGACVYPDVDKDGKVCSMDCNDADPSVFPGAFECKDGKDNDCSAGTADATAPGCECYVDTDRDGYAVSTANAIASAGVCPVGYTRRRPEGAGNVDCAFLVTAANPGQTSYFPTSYCPLMLATMCAGGRSFDYNCDGMATPFDATMASATCVGAALFPALCTSRSGWVGAVPACGAKGTYRQCTYARGGCTGTDIPGRVQECR